MEEKKVGKFEMSEPLMYSNRINCSFCIYELHMMKNSLDVDQREIERLMGNCTTDIQRYDLLEMKLKRAELGERVADMIAAATTTVKNPS